LEDVELEEFFEDTLNAEFNLVLEDNSAIQIARQLLEYRRLVREGRGAELLASLNVKKPPAAAVHQSVKFKDSNNNDDNVLYHSLSCIFRQLFSVISDLVA
jgi:hypothetical protein